MTVVVLPLFLPQASAAALTALVSASPELPIMMVSLAGPVAWDLLAPPKLLAPPHAERTRAPLAHSATATAPCRVLRVLINCLHRECGCPLGWKLQECRFGPIGRCSGGR